MCIFGCWTLRKRLYLRPQDSTRSLLPKAADFFGRALVFCTIVSWECQTKSAHIEYIEWNIFLPRYIYGLTRGFPRILWSFDLSARLLWGIQVNPQPTPFQSSCSSGERRGTTHICLTHNAKAVYTAASEAIMNVHLASLKHMSSHGTPGIL